MNSSTDLMGKTQVDLCTQSDECQQKIIESNVTDLGDLGGMALTEAFEAHGLEVRDS